jgi:pimeloyl-ACP methyl ester carboxylesterase
MRNENLRLSAYLTIGLLAMTTSCDSGTPPGDASSTQQAAVSPSGALEAGLHEWSAPDGSRIPYEVAGNPDAEVTVVLVHCWMCDRSFWDAQLPPLADLYRTVTLDLPGHGEAPATRETWTVSAYGEDVAGLISELGLTDVVLMGHSMGGPVSLHAAALAPDRVVGIVAVDTLHDAEFRFDGEQIQGFIEAFESDFVGTCEQFVQQMITEEDAEDILAHVLAAGCVTSRSEVGIALMRDYSSIDFPAWFRDAGVPIRAINAAGPNETRVEVNQRYVDFDAELMEGVGHYLHMTRPEQFNELMLEAIAEIVSSGS